MLIDLVQERKTSTVHPLMRIFLVKCSALKCPFPSYS